MLLTWKLWLWFACCTTPTASGDANQRQCWPATEGWWRRLFGQLHQVTGSGYKKQQRLLGRSSRQRQAATAGSPVGDGSQRHPVDLKGEISWQLSAGASGAPPSKPIFYFLFILFWVEHKFYINKYLFIFYISLLFNDVFNN